MKCKDAKSNIKDLMYIDKSGCWYAMIGDMDECFYGDGENIIVKFHTLNKLKLKDYEK